MLVKLGRSYRSKEIARNAIAISLLILLVAMLASCSSQQKEPAIIAPCPKLEPLKSPSLQEDTTNLLQRLSDWLNSARRELSSANEL